MDVRELMDVEKVNPNKEENETCERSLICDCFQEKNFFNSRFATTASSKYHASAVKDLAD